MSEPPGVARGPATRGGAAVPLSLILGGSGGATARLTSARRGACLSSCASGKLLRLAIERKP